MITGTLFQLQVTDLAGQKGIEGTLIRLLVTDLAGQKGIEGTLIRLLVTDLAGQKGIEGTLIRLLVTDLAGQKARPTGSMGVINRRVMKGQAENNHILALALLWQGQGIWEQRWRSPAVDGRPREAWIAGATILWAASLAPA